MIAIVISVFVKDDLIQKQINNLLKLTGINKIHIIFYQDSIKGSKKYSKYYNKYLKVKKIINENLLKFKSAEYKTNKVNKMPVGTCQTALDYAYNTKGFNYCIFMEDDVFLSKNSLNWFLYFYKNNYIKKDRYFFITGESIFYNAHEENNTPDSNNMKKIIDYTIKNELINKYIVMNHFLTSSIFATTKEIWNTDIRIIRGLNNGCNKLNDYINKNKIDVIFPILPYAKDIGMLHNDGWSVAWKGLENVSEHKNTYLLADKFPTPLEYKIIKDKKMINKIFDVTTKLNI